jgi:drug/metabolite transporter (DMT)-like permease
MTRANLARLLLLAALWGASFLFMRIAAPALGALPTAFLRVLLGAFGLVGIVLALRVPRQYKGLLGAAMMLGALNSGLPFLLFAAAATVLPAGYSAILNATTPLMAALLGLAAFGERLGAVKAAGVLLGFLGVAVMTRSGPLPIDAPMLAGVAACLTATACYALAGFLTRRWITQRGGLDSRLVALGSQCGATALLLPFAAWHALAQPVSWLEVPSGVWAAVLALGLLCTSWAYVLYFRLIAEIGPVKAMTVTFLIPLFGVLWGAIFLGEAVTFAHALGGGLIGLALWCVLRATPDPTEPDGPAGSRRAS